MKLLNVYQKSDRLHIWVLWLREIPKTNGFFGTDFLFHVSLEPWDSEVCVRNGVVSLPNSSNQQ